MSDPRLPVHRDRSAPSKSSMFVLSSLLEQLRDVITLVPIPLYLGQPLARVSGSVGSHLRHTLDHVGALVKAIEGDELRYDHRLRGTVIERDPAAGVHEIERLLYRLDRLTVDVLDQPVTFASLLHADEPAVVVRSTLAREVAFVIQHTIHHCALIAVLLEWHGWRVPRGFGVAPSTARARALAG